MADEHKAPTEKKVHVNVSALHAYMLVILLIILAYSLYALFQVRSGLTDLPQPVAPHVNQLTLTVLLAPNCPECATADDFSTALQQLPRVNITTVTLAHDTLEAQQLINEHTIRRLPAAIVTGEIENVTIPGFLNAGDASVFSSIPPPYYDLQKAGIVGLVDATFIADNSCTECFDITQFAEQMKQAGITVRSAQTLQYTDKEAQELVKKYSITKVPTLLLSGDALEYDILKQAWLQVGTQEADGILVMRNVTPPYRDLASRKINGLVTITYIVDPDCTACYNVSMHQLVLAQSFSMAFKTEKVVDARTDAAKALITKYGITALPTYLLDEEAAAYPALVLAWDQVGTRDKDGTFVFKKVDLLGGVTYKDLTTGQLMNATGE